MQIPIVSGIYSAASPDFRTGYPINMMPVPKITGISNGYLRPFDGLTEQGEGPGPCRGGINWQGALYRVCGSKLIQVAADGSYTVLGDVGFGGTVSMTYSFDRLAIAAGGNLFYWNGTALSQVIDSDLGEALDVIWIDGYFLTTDGEFLVVTELNNPMAVDPLKYGSSEVDPDPIVGVIKVRNEVYAINRYSMETFQNVGGTGFPFSVVRGAQIMRGAYGTHTAAVFNEAIAFLGSGRDEAPGVFLGLNGTSSRISTREIDQVLRTYSDAQLSATVVEALDTDAHSLLMVHLPDQTLCYDANASAALQMPAWFSLTSSTDYSGPYLGRHFVWCYGQFCAADGLGRSLGYLDHTTARHWGETVNWQFGTPIVYGEGRGGQFHELEVVCLTGGAPLGADPRVWTQYSVDGAAWSDPKSARAGRQGDTTARLRWMRQGMMRNYRMQRFRGNSDAPICAARLEARMEPLAW